MTWVGCDYDTHCIHFVRLRENIVATYYPCPLPGADAFERLRAVRSAMPSPGFWVGVMGVAIEEPGGKYVVGKLKAVQGAIVASLPADLLVAPYQATLWRKKAGMSGRATKDDVRAWVYERLGENPQWPQDACDAYCLAHVISKEARWT